MAAKTRSSKISPRTAGEIDRHVGLRVRTLRLERGLSQEDLAEAIGVTFQQIQKYEKGVNRVAASTLFAICKVLDSDVASFLPKVDGTNTSPNVLDDPSLLKLAPLMAELDADGRKLLVDLARTLVHHQTSARKR
ncbi:helix-turn-helix transcriptional regulator [Vitreimonas sp.]|uniref:helix-turn-helix domain-containing protein n=1 Tax=Vitreimonas sp. TaxID=3069702 RepID=UPI002EDAC282